MNSHLTVTGFCTASLNALRIPAFKWNKTFLGCTSVQTQFLRLSAAVILKILILASFTTSHRMHHHIGNSKNFTLLHRFSFNRSHYGFTGITLTDTHMREELGVHASSFQSIHGQFWLSKSSCHLAVCYFCFTSLIHNSTREKHTQRRKPSQAGQPAES